MRHARSRKYSCTVSAFACRGSGKKWKFSDKLAGKPVAIFIFPSCLYRDMSLHNSYTSRPEGWRRFSQSHMNAVEKNTNNFCGYYFFRHGRNWLNCMTWRKIRFTSFGCWPSYRTDNSETRPLATGSRPWTVRTVNIEELDFFFFCFWRNSAAPPPSGPLPPHSRGF